MADAVRRAADLLQARVGEVEAERRRLQAALDALTEREGSRRRSAGSSGRARRPAGRRAPRGERQRQLVGHLSENGSARPAEISKALGISTSHVHALLRRGRESKEIRKVRGGRYGLAASARSRSDTRA
jgi:hypothetical protein